MTSNTRPDDAGPARGASRHVYAVPPRAEESKPQAQPPEVVRLADRMMYRRLLQGEPGPDLVPGPPAGPHPGCNTDSKSSRNRCIQPLPRREQHEAVSWDLSAKAWSPWDACPKLARQIGDAASMVCTSDRLVSPLPSHVLEPHAHPQSVCESAFPPLSSQVAPAGTVLLKHVRACHGTIGGHGLMTTGPSRRVVPGRHMRRSPHLLVQFHVYICPRHRFPDILRYAGRAGPTRLRDSAISGPRTPRATRLPP